MFSRHDGNVRNEKHVEVDRITETGSDGVPVTIYRKNFKLAGWQVWSDRESSFINKFNADKLKHVVRLYQYKTTPAGTFSVVDTHDAGLTIFEWMQVAPRYADGSGFNHPFRRGEDFVRLIHACLVALKEIHDFGVVHCDIKQDNICLPCTPFPYRHDAPLKPDFAALKLIDFSFSLCKTLPLEQLLSIDPNHPGSLYLSPLLRAALNADLRNHKPEQTNKLDYRVDLYGLGYMCKQIMEAGSFFWETPERGVSGMKLIRELNEELIDLGSGKTFARYLLGSAKPHPRLIAKLDEWLKSAKPQEAFYPINQSGDGAASAKRYIPPHTPITPVLTPALDNQPQHAIEKEAEPVTSKAAVALKSHKVQWLLLFISLLALSAAAYLRFVPRIPPDPGEAQPVAAPAAPPISASGSRSVPVAVEPVKPESAKPESVKPPPDSVSWEQQLLNDNASMKLRRAAYRNMSNIASAEGSDSAAGRRIASFDNAWKNHDGRQNDADHWIKWAQILAAEGRSESALALADALAAGRDIARDRGQAYLLYALMGDNVTGQRKDSMEKLKGALLEEIVKRRDTDAGATVLPDVSRRAHGGESGYAYVLGLLNACALDKPNIKASITAYQLALKDQKPEVRQIARDALASNGRLCIGDQ